jgi:uncharacterized protein
MEPSTDPRFLRGIELFNLGDYFEAHEIWEELWQDCEPEDRRFYQGLIQAAVAIYHWGNGNWRGARRLFHSGRKYMSGYPDRRHGIAIEAFWQALEIPMSEILGETVPVSFSGGDLSQIPKLVIHPPPGGTSPDRFQSDPGTETPP